MKLSIVVPVYNEGACVREAHDAIVEVMRSRLSTHDYEIIFVDDGSQDDSFEHLEALQSQDAHVRVIRFVTNYGSHLAIRAGLEYARGDLACFLACDLQDPPTNIPDMLEKLSGSVQIVWAVRQTRDDPWTSKIFSKLFYVLARMLVSRNVPPNGASMFLLGPKALRAVRLFKERNLTLDGLVVTMGFRQAHVSYARQARRHGTSKWTTSRRLKLFADFFVATSYVPLRVMSYMGLLTVALGFAYTGIVFINRFLFAGSVPSWASLMVVVLMLGGLQMTMLGIIGEYIWRSLDEGRGRPRYIVDEVLETDVERPLEAMRS